MRVALPFLVVFASSMASVRAEESGHERMLRLLREIRDASGEEHFYLAGAEARRLGERLKALGPSTGKPDLERWEILVKLGDAQQMLGREQEAIDLLTEAYEMLPALEKDIAPLWVNRLLFKLGVAHLRQGETRNCALHPSAEACILPIRGGGIHADQDPSRRAIRYLTECMHQAPSSSEAYFSARWLLNLAYMTVGEYPDGVPDEILISPDAFASDESFPHFENVAHRAGVATFSLAGGAVAADFDLDGYTDLLVSSMDPAASLRLFINNEDKTFVERSDAANLTGLFGGLNMIQTDFDNDGDVDVLVLRGGWMASKGRHPNSLLRNNGDGTFTDVTFESGLGNVHYPTQTASWADFDHDGDLDVYIGNESTEELPDAPCQLFENRGDGTFVDIAAAAGVTNDRFAKAVTWGDYDADGWPDLFVSNIHDANRLYRNLGDGSFRDVALEAGVVEPRVSFPSWFWDFDNDGALDLYVGAYDATIGDLARVRLGRGYARELPRLYKGDGHGGFRDVATEVGIAEPNAPMGANFGDLDGDGFLDFYLGTGFPPYHSLMPNVMYRNQAGKHFADVSSAGGFGHLQKGHAIVFEDFDRDGDIDLFEELGGFFAGDRFHDALYENPGFGRRFLDLELVGVTSNRAAVGALVHLVVLVNDSHVDIYRHISSGGTFGANAFRTTIGLGEAQAIVTLEVAWPASARRQTFRNIPLDSRLVIREDADEVILLEDRSDVAFGGAAR